MGRIVHGQRMNTGVAIKITKIAKARVKGLNVKTASALVANAKERNITRRNAAGKVQAASE